MQNGRNYFDSVNEESYVDDQRELFKKRNKYSDTQYHKIVQFSKKLYTQALERKTDLEGKELTAEEIETAKRLIKTLERETKIHERNFEKDQ